MSKKSARRAFTFAELLVVLPLAALLFCGTAEVLVLLASAQTKVNDEIAAYARADRAWSILREPFALCGYGMPKDPAGYARAFPTGLLARDTFCSWPGPLSVAPSIVNGAERARGSCRIVHAAPSNATTVKDCVTSADRFTVELTNRPSNLEPPLLGGSPIRLKNWAVFGAAQPTSGPFWFSADDGPRRVILRRTAPVSGDLETVTIPQNDELFYLRATEALVAPYGRDDWAFHIDRHDGSGRQPRVAGVIDARFEPAPSGRIVKMHLLTRGDRRYNEEITHGTPPGWPEEYASDIPGEARHYRLYAFEMTFGVNNF